MSPHRAVILRGECHSKDASLHAGPFDQIMGKTEANDDMHFMVLDSPGPIPIDAIRI
jgi:hypothetical protein